MKLFSNLSQFRKQWILLFLIYTCIYFICFIFSIEGFYIENRSTNSYFITLINAIYYTIITQLTIGYGDIYPTQWWSKLLVISQVLFVIHFIIK